MDRFDFSPLFRSTIGFDRLTRMLDAATRVDNASLGCPPYDIEKTGDDAYRLTMAVAGFSPDELDVTVQENVLLVTGKAEKEEEKKNGYLHRGIARRAFERRFSLALISSGCAGTLPAWPTACTIGSCIGGTLSDRTSSVRVGFPNQL